MLTQRLHVWHPKREAPLVISRASSDVSHTLSSGVSEAFKGLLQILTSRRQAAINGADALGGYFFFSSMLQFCFVIAYVTVAVLSLLWLLGQRDILLRCIYTTTLHAQWPLM